MSLFYEVEDAIIARLEAKFTGFDPLPKVKHGSDLANIKDKSQGDLTVFVAYNGISKVQEAAETVRTVRVVLRTMTHDLARGSWQTLYLKK